MPRSLPVTLLLGGPLEGMRWPVDNAAVPLLRFDVPAGDYVRYVASRPATPGDSVCARVFYVHKDVSPECLQVLLDKHWEEGAVVIPVACELY